MLSSSSSSSSSHDSEYFSAILSSSFRQNTHGEENTRMESSSSASSSSSQSSSFIDDPSSGTTKHTHHEPIRFIEEDIPRMSSASSCSYSSFQPSSSNPSPSTAENIHEVFINFRGRDTRRGFVSYLHDALKRNGIRTYQDDRDLERGNEISSTLLRAIEQSKISIIVFSKNYASSRWTMDELVKIMNCHEKREQVVLPIFYDITPSEVRRKRSSSTGVMFRSSMNEIEQRWATAMKKAAGLAGWESSNYRTESELVEVIVNEVKKQLESMSLQGSDQGLSPQNPSPDEPNSGGSSSHDDPMPEDSSPRKCLSIGTLNLLGYLLWRKERERLILRTRRPDPPLNLDASRTVVYRNRYLLKQEQRWWGTQPEHEQQ
ncbi:hypothetical protein QN277_004234 [Acacia crassicarpa]|uniref:ADP-ribosyl cyclase/cyclic ADP-ribose hydrolase n=1 Tax=Acacia crassicarpa TaxID=499986 RepID=A0AAE1MBL9_9FABA|nr:hypothetical protein QN277_004234 [Acacia crassicarpa]